MIFVYVDYNRKGERSRGLLQPQIGALIAALLPEGTDVEVINETWDGPDWNKSYDLLFMTCAHSDFDRARQVSHYWRRRGTKTVFGGPFAGTYPDLCRPFFDAICIGDAESCVPQVFEDYCRGSLQPVYRAAPFDPVRVPPPRLDLLHDQQRLPLSIEITRGCPFVCEFCVLTGMGTRFHTRPIELVMRDLDHGRALLKGKVPEYLLAIAAFWDNNIGGNLPYLRRLCDALSKRHFWWGSSITFNALSDESIVKALSGAGCRFLFVGLESFNHDTIASMRKFQNQIDKTRHVLDRCRKHGILVMSGLMLSPTIDTIRYVERIPQHLREIGLHLPTFICFASPIPGTPYFHTLAAESATPFLPNAMLRDHTGYTLVVRPRHAATEEFVEAYKTVVAETYTWRARMRQLWTDLPPLLSAGFWDTALVDLIQHLGTFQRRPHPERTYLPMTDVAPPEMTTVPLSDDDFESEARRDAIMKPWFVTGGDGQVLPQWRTSMKVHPRVTAM